MKTIKKFTSFEDLKRDESKSPDSSESLVKHIEFQKFIKSLQSKKKVESKLNN